MGIKTRSAVVLLVFLLAQLTSYISPRYDIITLILHVTLAVVVMWVLYWVDERSNKNLDKDIKNLSKFVDDIKADREVLLQVEDDYSILREKIQKTLNEYKLQSKSLQQDRHTLQKYIEDIHHQIRTPLTGIGLMLDLIEQGPDKGKDYIDIIRRDIFRINDLTETLLNMSYLDANLTKLKKSTFGAKDMAIDVIHSLESIIPGDNIKITGDGFDLLGDKRWTAEALYNLIKNAYQVDSTLPIDIVLEENKIYQSITVRDYTTGIPLSVQQYIYDRFFKIDSESDGFGIGLSMVKSIMESQDGEILYKKYKDHNDFEMRFYK